jgi:hypothetical protein
VRTPAGAVLTQIHPADHHHHWGVSAAVVEVDGVMYWGGKSYVDGQGYVMLDNHGRQRGAQPEITIEDTLTTLAARIARLDRELEPGQRQQIVEASGGHTPASLANALLRAFDPDAIAERATGKPGASPAEVAKEKFDTTRQQLIAEACAPFDKPALRQTLENLKRETEQALDIYTPDEVIGQGFDEAAKAKDYAAARKHYEAMIQNCNACHKQFANGEYTLSP